MILRVVVVDDGVPESSCGQVMVLLRVIAVRQ